MPRKHSVRRRKPHHHAMELWKNLASRFKTCAMGEPIAMLRVQAVELLASFAGSSEFPPEFRDDEPVDDPRLAKEAQEFRLSLAKGLRFGCLRIPDGSRRSLPELAQEHKDLLGRCVLSWISALYALVSARSSFFAWDAKDRILDNLRPGGRFLTVDIRDIEADACRLLATILVVKKRSSGIQSNSKAPKRSDAGPGEERKSALSRPRSACRYGPKTGEPVPRNGAEAERQAMGDKRLLWDLYPLAKDSWEASEVAPEMKRPGHRVYMYRSQGDGYLGPVQELETLQGLQIPTERILCREAHAPTEDDLALLLACYPKTDPHRPDWYKIKAELQAAGHDGDKLDRMEAPGLLALLARIVSAVREMTPVDGEPYYKPAYFKRWNIGDELLRRNATDGKKYMAGKVRRQKQKPSSGTGKRGVYWYSEPDAKRRWPEKFLTSNSTSQEP